MKNTTPPSVFFLFLLISVFLPLTAIAATPDLSPYDVSWNSLGKDATDSMPLGNGDIALNAWTEANGDLLFYISKTDAWTENPKGDNGLAKVGRVRVSLSPNPFLAPNALQQRLLLSTGTIEITGKSPAGETKVALWVDAHHPVIHASIQSTLPLKASITLDPWRNPPPDKISADTILPSGNNRLVWYHRNEKTADAAVQNLTFGGLISGPGFSTRPETHSLISEPATQLHASVAVLTSTTPTAQEWIAQIEGLQKELASIDPEKSRREHERWWGDFWSRSHILVSGNADAEKVTQGYLLQRFITACAGRGAYPIKFNGSLFVVDNPALKKGKDKKTGEEIILNVTADYRSWGGQYWFQNTRAMYWPRLMAGDFDLMQPLFRMYRNQIEPNAQQVKTFYNHEGSYLAETAPFWGGIPNIKKDEPGSYTKDYYTPILELSALMLDYYDYTGDQDFVRKTLLPIANAGLTFFSQHFPRDASGKLFLDRANSIEMYWIVQNPLPDIAGLHWILPRLLALPENLATPDQRSFWKKLLSELPPIPLGTKDGKRVILPFQEGQESKARNFENPELYAIYPFRHFGLGKPDLDAALNAFESRLHKGKHCWGQDPIQAAYLGLTDEAQKQVTFNLTKKDPRLRFPAFWEKGHDYEPDQDNGGNGENGLQLMLMQCEGRSIRLLPAWPQNWNANFKLRAPFETTVEGRVENGTLTDLRVTPESRRADLIFPSMN
jgi:hypothetical protein